MFLKYDKGFTLIELVMVITILGILAVVAIPRFIDLRTDARIAAARGIQAAGEAGAQIWRARYLIGTTATYSTEYPGDSASCFEQVPPEISDYTYTYSSTTGRWTVYPK